MSASHSLGQMALQLRVVRAECRAVEGEEEKKKEKGKKRKGRRGPGATAPNIPPPRADRRHDEFFAAVVGCPEPQPWLFPKAVLSRNPPRPNNHPIFRTCTCKLAPSWQFSHTPPRHFIAPRHAEDSPLLPIISTSQSRACSSRHQPATDRYVRILADHLRDLPWASIAILIPSATQLRQLPRDRRYVMHRSNERADHHVTYVGMKRASFALLTRSPCRSSSPSSFRSLLKVHSPSSQVANHHSGCLRVGQRHRRHCSISMASKSTESLPQGYRERLLSKQRNKIWVHRKRKWPLSRQIRRPNM